jgi:hypothetical protein
MFHFIRSNICRFRKTDNINYFCTFKLMDIHGKQN